MLVFGGNDKDRSFRKPHVLDLATMTWAHPEVSGEAPAPRTAGRDHDQVSVSRMAMSSRKSYPSPSAV